MAKLNIANGRLKVNSLRYSVKLVSRNRLGLINKTPSHPDERFINTSDNSEASILP